MTLLIATVTTHFAMLSQDTAVYGAGAGDQPPPAQLGRLNRDVVEAIRATYVGDGTPQDAMPLRFASKARLLPQLHMAIGATGDECFAALWASQLESRPFGADVMEIDAETPQLLYNLAALTQTQWPTAIIHVGYSRAAGRACGFVYSQAEGFASAPIAPNKGHLMSPPPWTGHADYPELHRLCEPAARGVGTTAFHVALARNQHAAYRAGQFRSGMMIGGQVVTCVVNRDGLRAGVTHEFPEYRQHLAALLAQHREEIAELRAARAPVELA